MAVRCRICGSVVIENANDIVWVKIVRNHSYLLCLNPSSVLSPLLKEGPSDNPYVKSVHRCSSSTCPNKVINDVVQDEEAFLSIRTSDCIVLNETAPQTKKLYAKLNALYKMIPTIPSDEYLKQRRHYDRIRSGADMEEEEEAEDDRMADVPSSTEGNAHFLRPLAAMTRAERSKLPTLVESEETSASFSSEYSASLTKTPLRNYQLHLLKQCLSASSLLTLPTGSGKTLIAASLISHMLRRLNPQKLAFFVVPTVPLVFQQGNYLAKETGLRVLMLCGEILHSSEKAREKLKHRMFDILVITAQSLANLIRDGSIRMNEACVLVLDECHHSNKAHPYADLAKLRLPPSLQVLKTQVQQEQAELKRNPFLSALRRLEHDEDSEIDRRYVETTEDKEWKKCMPLLLGLSASPAQGKGTVSLSQSLQDVCSNLSASLVYLTRTRDPAMYADLEANLVIPEGKNHVASFTESQTAFETELLFYLSVLSDHTRSQLPEPPTRVSSSSDLQFTNDLIAFRGNCRRQMEESFFERNALVMAICEHIIGLITLLEILSVIGLGAARAELGRIHAFYAFCRQVQPSLAAAAAAEEEEEGEAFVAVSAEELRLARAQIAAWLESSSLYQRFPPGDLFETVLVSKISKSMSDVVVGEAEAENEDEAEVSDNGLFVANQFLPRTSSQLSSAPKLRYKKEFDQMLLNDPSEKFTILLECIENKMSQKKRSFASISSADDSSSAQFNALVFVKMRRTAVLLRRALRETNAAIRGLQPTCFFGHGNNRTGSTSLRLAPGILSSSSSSSAAAAAAASSSSSASSSDIDLSDPHSFADASFKAKLNQREMDGMSAAQQMALCAAFKQGKIQLLIATSVLEEGLDVASCSLVIMFDSVFSVRSFIQARGRARSIDSHLHIISSGDFDVHLQMKKREAEMYAAMEYESSLGQQRKQRREAEIRSRMELRTFVRSNYAECAALNIAEKNRLKQAISVPSSS